MVKNKKLKHILWFIPLLVVCGFFAYIPFAPEGDCGSQDPGLCFTYGIWVGFLFMPLAALFTPIGLFFALRKKKNEQQ